MILVVEDTYDSRRQNIIAVKNHFSLNCKINAIDFLGRAENKGYDVPSIVLNGNKKHKYSEHILLHWDNFTIMFGENTCTCCTFGNNVEITYADFDEIVETNRLYCVKSTAYFLHLDLRL